MYKIAKVKWEKDTTGFYVTPFIAVGNNRGEAKSLWIGWLFWLITIQKAANG